MSLTKLILSMTGLGYVSRVTAFSYGLPRSITSNLVLRSAASSAAAPEKRVDNVTISEGKIAICRCWKSKKMPRCDGAHNEHNKVTGDNLGPCIVTVAKPETKDDNEDWKP